MASTPSKPAEQPSHPLPYKTWVLKVSIHCEGCKKKVKKVLQSIDGVYTTTIDSYLHKVTVTGDVEAEALIKKLAKTGKHAQLWPEKAEKEKKHKNNKQADPPKEDEQPKVQEDQKKKNKEKEPAKPTAAATTTGKAKETLPSVENSDKVEAKDPKSGEKPPETTPTEGQPQIPPPEKEGENNGVAEKNGGGGKGGKKKGKKGQKSNTPTEGAVETPPNTAAAAPGSSVPPIPVNNFGPTTTPRQHVFQYPQYGPHPAPVYGVSYNTVYPSNSTAYYAPAAATPVSEPYLYIHHQHQGQGYAPPLPEAFEISYPPAPSDSFEIFSEENANGCTIM